MHQGKHASGSFIQIKVRPASALPHKTVLHNSGKILNDRFRAGQK